MILILCVLIYIFFNNYGVILLENGRYVAVEGLIYHENVIFDNIYYDSIWALPQYTNFVVRA